MHCTCLSNHLGPVVRRLDSVIHRIVNFSSAVKMPKSYKIANMNLVNCIGKV